MKIGIIGNSHIGSLKKAWDRFGGERGSTDIVFFGHRADGIEGLQLDGRRLVPDNAELLDAIRFTSGGLEYVDLDDFQVLLLYGMGASPFFVNEQTFHSKQATRRAMEDITRETVAFKLLKTVAGVYDGAIYAGHNPLKAGQRSSASQDVGGYLKGMALINEVIYGPLGARFMSQPVETIVNGSQTDIRFAKGSRRLAIGDHLDDEIHPDDNIRHMNAEFGALWLRKFLAEAASQEAGPRIGSIIHSLKLSLKAIR